MRFNHKQELAKRVYISNPQIVRYEAKGLQTQTDALTRLVDVFDVSIAYPVNGDK